MDRDAANFDSNSALSSLIIVSAMHSSTAIFFILFALFLLAVSRHLIAFDVVGLFHADN